MAEEFLQGGLCGGSWWNSPRSLFSSSPCSLASNDIGSFGWPSHEVLTEMKSVRSSDESVSDGSSSSVVQDVHKPIGSMPNDSSLDQMMEIGLSSSTTRDYWNQDLLRDSGRSEENYSNFLLGSSMNYRPQIKNFTEDSSIDTMKQSLNSISSSAECVTTCPGLSAGFELNSDSYSYASSLLQTLFDTDSQPQESLLDDQKAVSYSTSATNTCNQQVNSNGFLPTLSPIGRQPLSNNSPFWNSTAAVLNNVCSTFLPSPQSQFLPSSLSSNHKRDIHSIDVKQRHEQGKDLTTLMVKKVSNDQPAFQRPRIETPSPMPTFKVRKEKLGDRITALQQLVSPFGKTDTASVLQEAIEYIKFLHDQVNALSTPYLKYGSPPVQCQVADKPKDEQGLAKDLKTRGLCLVPISSTFPVAPETTTDFWTPTFGGSFR